MNTYSNANAIGVESLPGWKKILFASGQFGWSLAGFAGMSLLNYFYFPSETSQGLTFKPFVFQGAILGVLTIVGMADGPGRLFDAVSSLNAVWLVVTVVLFNLSLTAYTIPYTALIAELGHTSRDRLFLSTLTSAGWALGFFVGNSVYALKGLVMEFGLEGEAALRVVVTGFSVVGLAGMLMPVIFIDENRYARRGESSEKPFQAIRNTLKNPDFRLLLGSSLAYWIANTLLEAGIVFYVTILMGMPESMAFTSMAVMFVLSFALYPFVLKLANAYDKKRILIVGFIFQALVFLLIFACGLLDGTYSKVLGWTAIFVQAIPSAITGILPNAMVSDIARADGVRTGSHKAAAFFAGSSFVMKIAVSVGNVILPSLLLLGKSVENPTGVMVSALVAAFVMVLSIPLLQRYDEDRIARWLAREEGERVGGAAPVAERAAG